jgi:dTDP-4-dehydrorhamnose 3,5-epimerase-like enzyme
MVHNEEVRLMKGDLIVDDRGTVSFVNDFDFRDVKRFYVVENHQVNSIRAWHAHRNEGKYVFVARGTAIVATAKIDNWDNPSRDAEVHRFVMSEKKPSILWIPRGYANGFKSLTSDLLIFFFSTSTLEDSKADDVRFDADYFPNVWQVAAR